jgi:DNA-binding phage protein
LGFEARARELDKNPKCLMRMLSERGNPRADNLFAVVAHLRSQENAGDNRITA